MPASNEFPDVEPGRLPPQPLLDAQVVTVQALIDTVNAQRRTIGHLVTSHANVVDELASVRLRLDRQQRRLDDLEEVVRQSGRP